MKLGVLSDVHGNLPALKAVLSEFEKHDVEEYVCVGDVIGVLGSPAEVASLIRETARETVIGNHDLRVSPDRDWMPVHDFEVVEYEQTLDEIDDETYDWLVNLPGMITTDDGVVLSHSRPDPEAPSGATKGDRGVHPGEFTAIASDMDSVILLLGHTHYQHGVNLDKFQGQSGSVVNPGSVGFPFETSSEEDSDGNVTYVGTASYAIVDTETQEFELRSVEYDSTSVIKHLQEQSIDEAEGRRNTVADAQKQRRQRRNRRP